MRAAQACIPPKLLPNAQSGAVVSGVEEVHHACEHLCKIFAQIDLSRVAILPNLSKESDFWLQAAEFRKFHLGICFMKIKFDIDFSARRTTEGWSERQVGNGLAGVRNLRSWKRVRVWESANVGKDSRAGTREFWKEACVWESASVEKRLRLIEVRPQDCKARRGGKPRASDGEGVGCEAARARQTGTLSVAVGLKNKLNQRVGVGVVLR